MRSGASSDGGPDWLGAECDRLLDFAAASREPAGGFRWLDLRGVPDRSRPVETWITCRMTHVFALGQLLGRPGSDELVDHGVAALSGLLHDDEHGGWFGAVDPVDPEHPVREDKQAYDHAFVVLAAASATTVGAAGAEGLLAEALEVVDRRFWREDDGMVVDVWDREWRVLEPYRGVNANMHTTEALLAAWAVTGDRRCLDRAARILERVVHGWAPVHDWRIPEHFDAHWQPLPAYNRETPADQFRPYGATVGHWLEWARLALHLRSALGAEAPDWLLEDARSLLDAAVRDGWAVDGADGFVYTVDWDGSPVVRDRLHWVLCEALGAAAVLGRVTGKEEYARRQEEWWAYARRSFVDERDGSWWHQLDPDNRPATSVWPGKPDAYHAVQATLLPRLPLAAGVTAALAALAQQEVG